MDFTPTSNIKLLKNVPLDNTYKDTRSFSSASSQASYFTSKVKHTFSDFTYQRLTKSIRVPVNAEDCYDCNYVMFQNANFGTKWFYGFITEITYISQSATEIQFEIDVMQTWYFNYTLKPSFVEREHVNDDSIFTNLVPENLEYGDNIITYTDIYSLSSMAVVMAYVPLPNESAGGEMIDGVYTGLNYLWYGVTPTEIANLNSLISSFSSAGLLDNIVSIFMVPAQFVLGGAAGITLATSFNSIDGYTPKNNKLFSFPYRFVGINNNAGTEAHYKFEYFSTPTDIHFTIDYAYNMCSTANCHPDNYKGWATNWDEGIVLNNFPVCAWVGNVFANWYALNKMSIGQHYNSLVSGAALGAIGSAATGNILGIAGSLVGGINAVASQMAEVYQKQMTPYQIEGQIKCDTSNVKWERVGYQIKSYGIKAAFAKRIDDFFSMYGYKVNALKVPNVSGRSSWNYVKTIDCTAIGSVPVDDMVKIRGVYNSGVTFWHGEYVGDYTRTNTIV